MLQMVEGWCGQSSIIMVLRRVLCLWCLNVFLQATSRRSMSPRTYPLTIFILELMAIEE